jgi:hypothetical protein
MTASRAKSMSMSFAYSERPRHISLSIVPGLTVFASQIGSRWLPSLTFHLDGRNSLTFRPLRGVSGKFSTADSNHHIAFSADGVRVVTNLAADAWRCRLEKAFGRYSGFGATFSHQKRVVGASVETGRPNKRSLFLEIPWPPFVHGAVLLMWGRERAALTGMFGVKTANVRVVATAVVGVRVEPGVTIGARWRRRWIILNGHLVLSWSPARGAQSMGRVGLQAWAWRTRWFAALLPGRAVVAAGKTLTNGMVIEPSIWIGRNRDVGLRLSLVYPP